jgi:O-antigen/teichoic acid export membrane protein
MRLFSTAVGGQVLLSGANFLVGFILIRYTSDRDYGMYVLVTSTLLLLTTAQNAWLLGPLAVMAPRMSAEQRRGVIGAIKITQREVLRYLALGLLIVPVIGYLSGLLSALVASVVGCAILASWAGLRREYLRSLLLIYSRPRSLVAADAVYAAVLLAGVLIAVFFGPVAIVGAAFTLSLAAWAGAGFAHYSLGVDPGWVAGDARPVWPEIRRLGVWSLAGAVIYWLFGQSYNYLLATRLDLGAVADVNAARLMLMPAFVLSIGIASLLGPTAATWYVESGVRALLRRLMLFVVGVGVLDLCYFLVIWFARNWLLRTVLHKHIEDQDRLLLLWGAVVVVGVVRDVMQCALLALGRMKSMAWQLGYSAAAALLITWFGFAWWGASAVLIGQIAGELVNIAGIMLLLRNHLRQHPAP